MKKYTEKELLVLENKDVNKYYVKFLKQYMEETDNPLYRERQLYQNDLIRVCVNPKLNHKNRIHILRRAWFKIQQKMIDSDVVDLEVFDKSLDSDVFAIKDNYIWYLMRKYSDDTDKIYEDIKRFPTAKIWFEEIALKLNSCPVEILKMHYSNLK